MQLTFRQLVFAITCAAAVVTSVGLQVAPAAASFLGADGRIAFSRSPPRTGQHVFTITPSRRGLKQLTFGNTLDFTPAWSPGGRLVAFARLNSTATLDVFVVGTNGAGLAQITHDPAGTASGEPAWGPDGRAIAFTRGPLDGSAPSQIYTMNVDGTAPRRLTSCAVDCRAAAWTQGTIAYVQGEAARSSIWTMRPDGSHKRRLTGAGADHPDFSPTGSMIAFDRPTAGGGSAIYVMDRSGRHVRRVSGTRGIHQDPVFSPNGTLIAFSAGAKSRLALYTMTVAGRRLTRITGGLDSSFQPSWQPVLIAPV
jgi:Tol biopolymer transport system component